VGGATLEELAEASSDAEGAAYEAAESALYTATVQHPVYEDIWYPEPEVDAAAPAAATAEGCSAANLDGAVISAVETAIEVVVTAAVGGWMADFVWRGSSEELDRATYERYLDAEARERTWQLQQAKSYLESGAGAPSNNR